MNHPPSAFPCPSSEWVHASRVCKLKPVGCMHLEHETCGRFRDLTRAPHDLDIVGRETHGDEILRFENPRQRQLRARKKPRDAQPQPHLCAIARQPRLCHRRTVLCAGCALAAGKSPPLMSHAPSLRLSTHPARPSRPLTTTLDTPRTTVSACPFPPAAPCTISWIGFPKDAVTERTHIPCAPLMAPPSCWCVGKTSPESAAICTAARQAGHGM